MHSKVIGRKGISAFKHFWLFENRPKIKIHNFCETFQYWNFCLICMTHRWYMRIIYAKLFLNRTIYNKIIARKGKFDRYCVLALTFNRSMWFLHATHRLHTLINCANLFQNPTMHSKVTARKGISNGNTHKQTNTHTHTRTKVILYAPTA